MKYIDSEKITAKIDKIIDKLKQNCIPNPMGTIEECLSAAEIEVLELVKSFIDDMKQDEVKEIIDKEATKEKMSILKNK